MKEFEDYLAGKKIDSVAFKAAEPERWAEFETLFGQAHPKSFTMQKLFLINKIRRMYPLQQEAPAEKPTTSNRPRPVIRRKKPE